MPHPFLSDEWIDAARAIRAKHADEAPDIEPSVRINLVVLDVPFDKDEVRAFLDTSDGGVVLEFGELDEPDATVTTDYDTAKAIFVDQDPAVAMQAFMSGLVKVQGDMMKLMAMQGVVSPPDDDRADQIAQEIRDITE